MVSAANLQFRETHVTVLQSKDSPRWKEVQVQTGETYWYAMQDRALPFCQVFVERRVPNSTATKTFQLCAEMDDEYDGKAYLVPLTHGVPRPLRPLLFESGRPPVEIVDEPRRGVSNEPCLYCRAVTMPVGMQNAWNLATKRPAGQACRSCGRIIVYA